MWATGLLPSARMRSRKGKTVARNSAGRLRCTAWPAPSIVTSVASGTRPASLASSCCGTGLVDPPPITSVGAVIAGSSAHQAGSGRFSCARIAWHHRPVVGQVAIRAGTRIEGATAVRRRRVDQDQPGQPAGAALGEERGDRPAHGVAAEDEPVEAERVGELAQVLPHRLQRVGRGAGARSVPALIRGDHPVSGGELRGHFVPGRAVARHPVQQHQRRCRPVAVLDVGELARLQLDSGHARVTLPWSRPWPAWPPRRAGSRARQGSRRAPTAPTRAWSAGAS